MGISIWNAGTAVTAFAHTTVLADEAVELLLPRDGGVYCDGTLGGGGHTQRILDRCGPTGRVIGIDRDQVALEAARERLAVYGDRVSYVHGTFGAMAAHLAALNIEQVDGILIDIGISSPQVDVAERGFSISRPGPLDMRMDRSKGPTCADLLRDCSADELSVIIRDYGEERYAKRIAQRIKEAVRADAIATTADLAAVIVECIPGRDQRKMKIHPATKTFQALRIAVNDELGELERFLASFPALLRPGGRCVVISFHSLEDRLVKNCFRDLAWSSSLPRQYAIQAGERPDPICTLVTRKSVTASEQELVENPRARSARLRACEKAAAA